MDFARRELWREGACFSISDNSVSEAALDGADTKKSASVARSEETATLRANACALQFKPNRGTKKNLVFSAQRSTGEEDHAEQDMDDVVHLTQHQQRADIEHMIGAGTQEPAANAEQ